MLALTDFEVFGFEATIGDVLMAVEEANPDVIVLGYDLPGSNGIAIAPPDLQKSYSVLPHPVIELFVISYVAE